MSNVSRSVNSVLRQQEENNRQVEEEQDDLFPEEKYEDYADEWDDEPAYENMKRRTKQW